MSIRKRSSCCSIIVANEIATKVSRAPREARDELERRGLDDTAVAQVRALIETATSMVGADDPL